MKYDREILLQEEQEIFNKHCEIIYKMKCEIAKEIAIDEDDFWNKMDILIDLDEDITRHLYKCIFNLGDSYELISFKDIIKMFPNDEEIKEIINNVMKEYKEEIDSNDK